jgi:hypothetical protein
VAFSSHQRLKLTTSAAPATLLASQVLHHIDRRSHGGACVPGRSPPGPALPHGARGRMVMFIGLLSDPHTRFGMDCSCPADADIGPTHAVGPAWRCRCHTFREVGQPILPLSAALVADQAHHRQFGRSLSERVGTVGHAHNQLSRLIARSIIAVALSISALPPGLSALIL